jgi:hypothetical protein
MQPNDSAERFAACVDSGPGALLRVHGFRRARELESTSPTHVTVLYKGANIAFEFALDRRDDAVVATVLQVRNGQLVRKRGAGFESDLFAYLVYQQGYRGSPTPSLSVSASNDPVEASVNGLTGLLRHPLAASLLADAADALPGAARSSNAIETSRARSLIALTISDPWDVATEVGSAPLEAEVLEASSSQIVASLRIPVVVAGGRRTRVVCAPRHRGDSFKIGTGAISVNASLIGDDDAAADAVQAVGSLLMR